MLISNLQFLWFLSLIRLIIAVENFNHNASGVKEFLDSLNEKSSDIASKLVTAQWEFETHNTESAKKKLVQVTSEAIKNAKLRFNNVVTNYPWRSFSCPDLRRQFKLYSEIGVLALPSEEYEQFQKVISDIETLQHNTTICDYYNKTKCDLHLNPDIKERLETSQNSEELLYLWTEWRKVTEKKFTRLLNKYVSLCNHAAILNNYTNFREYTLRNIEKESKKEEILALWEGLQPLYQQIHAYVRKKLRDIYGDIVPKKGLIPSYLLGNIWSENWSGIAPKIMPFPKDDNFNFTLSMISQGYSQESVHKFAEDFFKSLNFSIPTQLWFYENKNNLSNKKSDRCHSKIFNLYNNSIRIKDCWKTSFQNYLTAHRLLAKAEYMVQYSKQPFVYQSPADPGLEEAINNVVMMSISTFNNLKNIGIYNIELNEKLRLNRLFKVAMEKVTSIPFLIVQEFWRWEIYSGKPVEETSFLLRTLRGKFQGISTFTKELNFDPGGTGSVFSKLSLIHRFLGVFLEFQMYESLCQISGESKIQKELNECNLAHSNIAGTALREIMSLGSSKSLGESLEPLLRQNKISSDSLLNYFKPLMNWLKKENEKTGESIGWEEVEESGYSVYKKRRRKRSVDDYLEDKTGADNSLSKNPDRFQRLIRKRSKDTAKISEKSERERKCTKNTQGSNSMKNKNSFTETNKERRNIDKKPQKSKSRRSSMKNSRNIKEIGVQSNIGETKSGESSQKSNKLTPKTKKRHSGSDSSVSKINGPKTFSKSSKIKDDSSYKKKRNDDFETSKNYENTVKVNNINNNGGSSKGNNKMRYARKTLKKERRHSYEENEKTHQVRRRMEKKQNQKDRISRDAQWHTNTKKDISRLLHSFGFAIENDEKDKIKEPKKKIKGDMNSDLKGNLATKEKTYESMVDFGKLKSGEGRSEADDKGSNKLWSVKSFMSDNAKVFQTNPMVDKKEGISNAHLSNSMLSQLSEETSVGKKESSSNIDQSVPNMKLAPEHHFSKSAETPLRHFSIEVPSLQTLLKNADLNANNQKPIYSNAPDMSSNINQVVLNKNNPTKFGTYVNKYLPSNEVQFSNKKEVKNEIETGIKSPYVIILGQLTPELREKLFQEKGNTLKEIEREPLQNEANSDRQKLSDKRSKASEQIYIVPLGLKGEQQNFFKAFEHEQNSGHDSNAERNQASENAEKNSNIKENNDYLKTGKENQPEFYISWNSDKTGKLVKRSKREHDKDTDNKLKVVRIAPMKESFLEGLLGKPMDRETPEDKNVKILFHDSLMNSGGGEMNSGTGSMEQPAPVSSSVTDDSQGGAVQPPSEFSSIASSVISALSPKSYSQTVGKTDNQHQDSELEEDTLKENSPPSIEGKESKDQDAMMNAGLRCNSLVGKKKASKLAFSDDEPKKDTDSAAKEDNCCKKIILTPCPPKFPPPTQSSCPCVLSGPPPTPQPCPMPCPMPRPPPGPPPVPESENCNKKGCEPPNDRCNNNKPENDLNCKKPSECSLVNCQFKITKAKKPHERLTIMVYDSINPPAELPEPYDALLVISEILQRIQSCSNKQCTQLTEEDPDYPANDNTDQLKGNQPQDKGKLQELSGELPALGNESPEEDETDDNLQNSQNSPDSSDEDKYQPKEKATPAIDQLTVFDKDKLKPVFIELRKIDDLIKKRSKQG